MAAESLLGTYLKDRRSRLKPEALGFAAGRRRTPGLRREEVAQRANISSTWYTWLEQGRGGAPSAGVLDRIARALMLTEVEREHLFLLGLGRPPEVHYLKDRGITARLQRVLEALQPSPALIRTPTWHVIAWNRAAQYNWDSVARYIVGAFRVDAARAGAAAEIEPMVDELCRLSPEFKAMWLENDVMSHGEAVKHIKHAVLGPISFEYSAFAIEGRPDLTMVVYNPTTDEDAAKIASLS